MKQLILLFAVVGLIGCGGGGGGSSDSGNDTPSSPSAPEISNLQLSPSSAKVGSSGGSVDISMTFDFTDIEGDITSMVLLSYDENWNVTDTASRTIDWTTPNPTSGTIHYTINNLSTNATGTYYGGVYVEDEAGNTSNTLVATFTVTP